MVETPSDGRCPRDQSRAVVYGRLKRNSGELPDEVRARMEPAANDACLYLQDFVSASLPSGRYIVLFKLELNKKLSCRRGTARRSVSVEIFSTTAQSSVSNACCYHIRQLCCIRPVSITQLPPPPLFTPNLITVILFTTSSPGPN